MSQYNRELAARPGNPSAEYIDELDRLVGELPFGSKEQDRVQAELEDIEDGHWDGPRTDL